MIDKFPTYSEEKVYFLPYGFDSKILSKTYFELVDKPKQITVLNNLSKSAENLGCEVNVK